MLQFAINDTSVELILTLTEKVTLSTPYYLFVFTHVTTKDQVKFIKAVADDESTHQSRYNAFTINPAVIFLDKQPGQWHYKIYEQESAVNTDVSATGDELEDGKLILTAATAFEYTKYHSATSYNVYNG